MFRYLVVFLLAPAAIGFAQMVSFDGTSFPEEQCDWIRRDFPYPADRWIDDGWLVQYAEIVAEDPPFFGEQDYYEHSMAAFTGADTYVEWVMVTDGPAAFGAIAPAALVAANDSGVAYHFVIGEDRLAFTRGAQDPFVVVDLDPGPHLFRLELRGTESYRFMIDGVEIDAGVPAGPFPTPDSMIVFGARAAIEASTTRWDYVRVGVIPADASGDFDGDADLDLDDYSFFRECLSANGPGSDAWAGCLFADMDEDGDVDLQDFALFQRAFTGGE